MSVSYDCPNPECGVTLKTASRVQVGKSVKCPNCGKPFVPELGAEKEKEKREQERKAKAAGKTDDGALKLAADKQPVAQPAAATPAQKPFVDPDEEDDESIKKGYGVTAETEEEKE